MRLLANGDVADVLQNVRWQLSLYTTGPRAPKIGCSADVRKLSQTFIQAYGARKATNKDYPDLIRRVLSCLRETADALGDQKLHGLIAPIQAQLGSLRGLQKAHREFLLRLQELQA
jgi:hypothetical protein